MSLVICDPLASLTGDPGPAARDDLLAALGLALDVIYQSAKQRAHATARPDDVLAASSLEVILGGPGGAITDAIEP